LLARSDVVTVHVPLLPSTHGLIGASEIALMQPHAALVNTARGGVVDETALAAALEAGALRTAFIDVFESEPPDPDHPLLHLEQAVCTPHVAGSTFESLRRMADDAVSSVLAVLSGHMPEHIANADVMVGGP
jgi:phosphoglycerate dehydrogenase-like enzyme